MTDLERLVEALAEIGIECCADPDAEGFLENVRISNGTIRYKPTASLSNILHEAGHLACLPPVFRAQADGDLDDLNDVMCNYATALMERTQDADTPFLRAIMQCSDTEATAWAWAFGSRLGLTPEQIIEDGDYDDNGDEVRIMVSTGMHLGVHGLRAAGMIDSTKNWPHLTKWMQDAREEEN